MMPPAPCSSLSPLPGAGTLRLGSQFLSLGSGEALSDFEDGAQIHGAQSIALVRLLELILGQLAQARREARLLLSMLQVTAREPLLGLAGLSARARLGLKGFGFGSGGPRVRGSRPSVRRPAHDLDLPVLSNDAAETSA